MPDKLSIHRVCVTVLISTLASACSPAGLQLRKLIDQPSESSVSTVSSDVTVEDFERADPPVHVAGVSLVFACTGMDASDSDALHFECSFITDAGQVYEGEVEVSDMVLVDSSDRSTKLNFEKANGAQGNVFHVVVPADVVDVGSRIQASFALTGLSGSEINGDGSTTQSPVAEYPLSAADVAAADVAETAVTAVEPEVVPEPKQALPGQWMGLCAHVWNSADCEVAVREPMQVDGTCLPGFSYEPVAARFQGTEDNSALNEHWTGTCVRDGALAGELAIDPARFAVAGSPYGICVYTHNSATCDVRVREPVFPNKTCPLGFRWTHVAARYLGNTKHWVGTCVADATGTQAQDAASGSWYGVCPYDYQGTTCLEGFSAFLGERGVCSESRVWTPFAARHNGLNQTWVGTCMVP